MTEFWEFAMEHWFITFLLVGGAVSGVVGILYAVLFRLPNRLIRHLNIRKAGWPPPHVDADGDFKKKDVEDDDEEDAEDIKES